MGEVVENSGPQDNLGRRPVRPLPQARFPDVGEVLADASTRLSAGLPTEQRPAGAVDVLLVNPPAPDGGIWIRSQHRVGRRSRENMIWPQVSLAQMAALLAPDYSVEIVDAIPHRMTWAMYKPFFDKMLAGVVKKHHPGIDYIPSSQYSPTGDRRFSSNPACGDAHVWNVWHLKEPFEWYRTSLHRFCSEYGFQSFPEPRTLEAVTEPKDRNLTSRVMEHHQRSGIGNALISHYMLSWFRMPTGFENTVWLSQIQQGLAIKYAVEHWRRHMPRCMGSLYWQINDTWPGPTWSSLDYFGRWKALHYMARAFYSPLLVTGLEDLDKKTVELHVSNTGAAAATGTVQWTLTTAGGETVQQGKSPVRAPANTHKRVTALNLRDAAATHGDGNLMLWLELLVGRTVVSRNLVLLVRPKHIELQDPKLKATVQRGKRGGAYTITLSTARPALWTWLELAGLDARISDNFLCVRPGLPITIELTPSQQTTLAEVRKRLKVRSLFDTYHEPIDRLKD